MCLHDTVEPPALKRILSLPFDYILHGNGVRSMKLRGANDILANTTAERVGVSLFESNAVENCSR